MLERGLMPGAAVKRPHSTITSQKRLASCDTGNRMAFVSFRIMSSPGYITLIKTTSADTNVIMDETTPFFLREHPLFDTACLTHIEQTLKVAIKHLYIEFELLFRSF